MAVILHKPFDALAVMTLMQSNGCRSRLRRLVNIIIALITPIGVALAFLGLGGKTEANSVLLGCALGFCAGSFLCIACSDLLPELHFHSHDRWRLSLALLAGLGVSILVGQFESGGHGYAYESDQQQYYGDRTPSESRRSGLRATTPPLDVGLVRRQSAFLRSIPHLHFAGFSETVLHVQEPPQLQK